VGSGFCESAATEWRHGNIISLGGLPGFANSAANNINDAGRATGSIIPESSTWAMMLLGFAGLR